MKIRWITRALALTLLLSAWSHGAVYLFDFGTTKSSVKEGFARVTADDVFSAQAKFGWQTREGLKMQARAFTNLVENRSRGTTEPPPVWTNPLTEDSISSARENTFTFVAKPGEYEIYVLCGTSEAVPNQYFDFTVETGGQSQRVQIESGQVFRAIRLKATASSQPIIIRFSPRSKWVVNALMAWTADAAARVGQTIIAPLEEWVWRMPPEEWKKWKEQPEPEPGPMPAISAGDRQRGFLVYSRHYLECVYPHTRPQASDLNPTLRLFGTPGEYEPMNFVVHPLADLKNAKVRVSAIGPVPSDKIDVRHVRFQPARLNYTVQYRYRVVPDVLEHFEKLDMKAGENARFWITIHVPEDAPPGLYNSKIIFECSGGNTEIPVKLRVLPIRLRDDPTKLFGIYYRHPYDRMASAEDDVSREYFKRRAELEHADMIAHGTRNVVLSNHGSTADANGKFTFNWDLLTQKLELWHKFKFQGPIVMGFNTEGVYRKYMKESYGSHLRGVKDPPEAFSHEITAMVNAIETERRQRGWPEFLYYPVDEPGTDPASVNFMIKVLKACRTAGVRTYITADPTHEQFDPLRPLVDVWCTQPFAPDRETVLADMKARRVEYWCYPNHVNGENDHTPVTGARMTYGFGFWRSGFVSLIPWIYSYTVGDPSNYLDGSTMDFFNRHEPDGTPMPVTMWEAYREGYDDYRYLFTLEQTIAEAGKSQNPKVREAVQRAQKELKLAWNSIKVLAKYKADELWAPEEFDVNRWLIAGQIMELEKLRPW